MAVQPSHLSLIVSHDLSARREAARLLTDLFVAMETLDSGDTARRLIAEAALDVRGLAFAVGAHAPRLDVNPAAWEMLANVLGMAMDAPLGDRRWRWLTVAGALRTLCEDDLRALDYDGQVLPCETLGRRHA